MPCFFILADVTGSSTGKGERMLRIVIWIIWIFLFAAIVFSEDDRVMALSTLGLVFLMALNAVLDEGSTTDSVVQKPEKSGGIRLSTVLLILVGISLFNHDDDDE